MEKKTQYTAQQIAQWFINRSAMDVDMFGGEYVTNMKLQKLLYFAQGLSLAIFDKTLFEDVIEAWQHGPVVHSVYTKYSRFAKNSIPDVDPIDFDSEISALLEFVYEKYGKYTASELRNISHEHEAYKNNYIEDERDIEIPVEEIRTEFGKDKKKLVKEFNENKDRFLDYAETCYINSVPEMREKIAHMKAEETEEVDWKNEL